VIIPPAYVSWDVQKELGMFVAQTNVVDWGEAEEKSTSK
jgi:hypothetical protein